MQIRCNNCMNKYDEDVVECNVCLTGDYLMDAPVLTVNWRRMSEADKDAFLLSYHTATIMCNCLTCINERETNAKLGNK